MTPLSDQQKQLLFDYSLGLISDRDAAEAERLLSWHAEAIELHDSLRETLAPLDTVEWDPCPDELTERLFQHLRETARQGPGATRADDPLPAEQSRVRTIKIPLWRNWGEVVAAAAVVVLLIGALLPAVGSMRQRYAVTRCGTQLGGVFDGFRSYAADHDGLLPAITMAAGSPWWKVGYQGPENYSNTRRAWLLVKYEYVDPEQFFCAGRRETRKLNYDGFKIQRLNDFPSRMYIHFSMPVACPTSDDRDLRKKRVLMADRNPLSERLPSDHSTLLNLQLGEKHMTANSGNHRNRGQNVSLYDGSVEFISERHTSISEDDIYTLQGMGRGTAICGCEFPACDTDFFLAP